ncbi:hypothetical protein PT974_03571 [Cladobotryum mycophilum]|uniref:Uncharacterized protein n=1 Tax=Cladobotryum mycophilum TaxID=491253 RepID=A0ABR0SSR8_9HYPO
MYFDNDKRLVALFIGYDKDNKQKTVKVAIAELNPSSPLRNLVFHKVLDLNPPKSEGIYHENYSSDGEFVFDHGERKLIYASRSITHRATTVVIWHIDPYFYIPHAENTTISGERGQSILLDGNLLVVSTAGFGRPNMAGKLQNGQWWTQNIRAEQNPGKKFVPIHGEPSWQPFELKLGQFTSESFTTLAVQDPSTRRYRVYFFCLTPGNVVTTVHIELRKDGSVLSDVGKSVQGKGRLEIRLPTQAGEAHVGSEQVNLSALAWNSKVLLLVRFKKGLRAVIGNVLSDGRLDEAYDWKHLPVSLEMGDSPHEERFGGSTIVDPSFVG